MFAIGDKVKTMVSPFDTTKEVKHGVIAWIHPKDAYAPYIVDFGDDWGGFPESQLEEE